jgi:hypothetical protein
MATEHAGQVQDFVTAELVECAPEPEVLSVTVSEQPVASPVRDAMEATLEQTGAGPPPNRTTDSTLLFPLFVSLINLSWSVP